MLVVTGSLRKSLRFVRKVRPPQKAASFRKKEKSLGSGSATTRP